MKNKGFTLMEMLLALALLSIMLAALYSTFFLSEKAVDSTDETLLRFQECRMAMDCMRRELDSAMFNGASKNAVFLTKETDIYGKNASTLVFNAFSPNMPGLSTIEYYVEEKKGKLALMRRMCSCINTDKERSGAEIVADVESFAVEIRSNSSGSANSAGWVNTWDAKDTGKMPDEVRIRITVLIKGRSVPFFETVRPNIGKTI